MVGNTEEYILIDGDKVHYECPVCGEKIMSADVSKNPPWITAFKGDSDYKNMPYCPKCDDKPEYKGVSNISTENSEESIMMKLRD
ncbi:MAG: hypothetical protein KAI18_03795 [Candidatus Aenigmarchaeota archaeon]|nr:hypothetical protein [Candidatus Aenigmarchaeota archaeon]